MKDFERFDPNQENKGGAFNGFGPIGPQPPIFGINPTAGIPEMGKPPRHGEEFRMSSSGSDIPGDKNNGDKGNNPPHVPGESLSGEIVPPATSRANESAITPDNIPAEPIESSGEERMGLDTRPWRDPFKTEAQNDAIEARFREDVFYVKRRSPSHTRTADGTSTVEIETETLEHEIALIAMPDDVEVIYANIPDGDGVALIHERASFPLLVKVALESGSHPLPPEELDATVAQAVAHVRTHLDKADEVLHGDQQSLAGVRLITDEETGQLLVEPMVRHFGFTDKEGFNALQCGTDTCGDVPKVYVADGPEIVVPNPTEEVQGRVALYEHILSADVLNPRAAIEGFDEAIPDIETLLTNRYLEGENPDLQAFYNLSNEQSGFVGEATALIQNSLDNFAQHFNDNGQVHVGVYEDPSGKIHIIVTDNGSGVPVDEEETILQPGFRSKKEDYHLLGGNGIALQQLRDWAQSRGNGDLTYTKLERGSRFTVSIDPHTHEYPVNEIGEVTSPQDAREKLSAYYLDRMREMHARLAQQDEISERDSMARDTMKYYLDEEANGRHDSSDRMAIYHAREYINRYTATE